MGAKSMAVDSMNEKSSCVPRDMLKEYLAGWVDSDQSDVIETHLAECQDCEQTIVELESNLDTLVDFVREVVPAGSKSGRENLDDYDDIVASAISRSRRMDPKLVAAPSSKNSGSESAKSLSQWQPPSTDIGAYELIRPLGTGGMGTVYLAKHRKLAKEVAIKLLPARTFRNDHFAARFQREIRVAGGLDHPSIVRATDAGEYDGTHYLVMEHIDGLDLSRIARRLRKLDIADACEIARQVALGLSHAHAEGIVHRDVKPSNLMVDKNGEVKVLDFGLARLGPWDEVSAELTTVGQLMGTLDYMAPEQAERADSADYRADLYALGATLFRLLCGRPPLSASPEISPLAKLRLMATHEPPSLSTLRSDAPTELAELVAALLSRDPAARPASAAHVAEQLSAFTSGHGVESLVTRALEVPDVEPETEFSVNSLSGWKLPNEKVVGSDRIHSRTRWRWLVAAMTAPVLLLAGVLITLETQKGQLVIRSDAEVQIKIIQDGKTYRELSVVPGVNETRLFAGRYEVVVDGGSDHVAISDSDIVISRGQTEIATIARVANTSVARSLASPGEVKGVRSDRTVVKLPASDDPIQPGDRLRVHSSTAIGLDWTATVAADSTLRVPMIGNVDAKGLTVDEFRERLNAEYRKLYSEPNIEVFRADLTKLEVVRSMSRSPGIPPASTEKLQPGDGLKFWSIADNKLGASVVVLRDGKVRVPLAGTVSVGGMTVDEARQQLEQAFSKYIHNPAIDLFRDPTFSVVVAADTGTTEVAVANGKAPSRSGLVDRAEAAIPLGTPATASEPLYDGKSLTSWLQTLSRERSPKALADAFTAVEALVSEESSQRITETLLEVIPKLNGGQTMVFERSRTGQNGERQITESRTNLDSTAFELLAKANPDNRYERLLIGELDRGEAAWTTRILAKGIQRSEGDGLQQLLSWLENNILQTEERSPHLQTVANFYFDRLTRRELDEDQKTRVRSALRRAPHLDADFWLDQVWTDDEFEVLQLAKSHAIEAILSDSSPGSESPRQATPTQVTQAAMQLQQLALGKKLSQEEIKKLVPAINRRLGNFTEDELLSLVPIAEEMTAWTAPTLNLTKVEHENRRWASGRGVEAVTIQFGYSESAFASQASELLCLGYLLSELDAGVSFVDTLKSVRDTLADRADEVQKSWRTESKKLVRINTQLNWPDLDPTGINYLGTISDREKASVEGKILSFSAEDWMAWILVKQISSVLD